MGLGWEELGDLTQYESQTEVQDRLQELFPEKSQKYVAHMPWQFANVIKPGDVVFAKSEIQLALTFTALPDM